MPENIVERALMPGRSQPEARRAIELGKLERFLLGLLAVDDILVLGMIPQKNPQDVPQVMTETGS